MITLYGIRNCDTVRRARDWLGTRGVEYRYHDLRADGLDAASLDRWLDALGWESLLNRRGTTWRRLDEATRAAVTDRASARACLLAHPSLIKRPVMDWGGSFSVGFQAEDFAARSLS